MNANWFLALLVGVFTACSASQAYSYNFVPKDEEFHQWPGHCQAKYVWTNIGSSSKWVSVVGEAQRAELRVWEGAGIAGLHHYCAGTTLLQRARFVGDAEQRKSILRAARSETEFTYSRSNRTSPLFLYVAIQMATIVSELGDAPGAISMLQEVLKEQPQAEILYSAIAVSQMKLNRSREAKETLLQGVKVLERESAEVYYNLGLVSLELGEVDSAADYASRAYELGFPLPGLRNRLQKLGKFE
jgi:tetratricopeptide (TPR) repeat protein